MSRSTFLSSLTLPHPLGAIDLAIGFGSIYLVILGLLTPPTLPFKLLRVGIIAPLAVVGFLYSSYWPIPKDYEEIWGSAVFMDNFALRTLELLVFFPAEENVYRLRPSKELKA